MSIGLMERLPLSFMEDCMADMSGTGESPLCIVPLAVKLPLLCKRPYISF